MTTYRTTWIPADHFAPDHRDFWARQPADHYADIQRQLGARDVGVTSFEESRGAGTGLRGHRSRSEALSPHSVSDRPETGQIRVLRENA